VLTRDQNDPDAPLEYKQVTQLFRHTVTELDDVVIQAADGSLETIQCTPEHPFYVDGQGWTDAGDLVAGEHLVEPDGTEVTVVSSTMEAHPEGVTVYNFEVDGDHTYFVSADGQAVESVWVHNSCKVSWVKENAAMSKEAAKYQAGAAGARKGFAPALTYKNPGGRGTIRFDGIEKRTLIDRKLSFYSTDKAKDALLRASSAIRQNKGYALRIEVPTQSAYNRGMSLFDELGITNIKLRIVP
jgi:hypothetical protein